MKISRNLIGGLSCALAGASWAATPVDIYILAGQSNMEGRAHRRDLPAELNRPQNDVLFFFEEAWGPLAAGSSRRPEPPDGFGPELSFGKAIAEAAPAGRKVALIKHAVGGTSLSDDWRPPTGEQSQRLFRKVRVALAELKRRGYESRLAAFIWLQGERDAGTKEQAEAYSRGLREFILHVREALNAPELPIVIGKITPHSQPARPYSEVVRRAQLDVVGSIARATLVDTDDLRLFEEPAPDGRRVRVHFDAESLVTLGRRLAYAALEFEPRK